MKALLLTNEFPPYNYGGAGVHVEYLTRELVRLMDVDVRCFGDQSLQDGALSVKGVLSQEASLPEAPEALKSTLNTLLRSIQFNAFPVDADVVHCHTWYTHFGGILAKLLYEIPLVITTHSLEPLRPWKKEQLGSGYNLSSWVEKTALEMADAVIAVSGDTKQDILKCFDIAPHKIEIIPNGIDISEYHKVEDRNFLEQFGVPADMPYVLFVGRITRQKGIIHLVDAIRHLDEGLGVVLCAGAPDTPEIEVEMAQSVAEIQGKRKNVYWISEMLSREAIIQFYSHASIFCCPSIYEPFGIINLEAMACRTPVVASAVGGIKEVVVDGETGLLVNLEQETEAPFNPVSPAGFAKDLAAAINRLYREPALCARMAEAGLRRVEEKYSWQSIAEKVHALFRRLVS